MKRDYFQFVVTGCLMAMILIGSSGCGGETADEMFAEANKTNIQRVATLYSVYLAQHEWVGPSDESQLKTFSKGLPNDQLARIGLDSSTLDSVFKSEVDQQPFKYRFEIKTSPRDAPTPIVFQSSPVEGRFRVAFTQAVVKSVEQSEYDQLWNTNAEQPAKTSGPPGPPRR